MRSVYDVNSFNSSFMTLILLNILTLSRFILYIQHCRSMFSKPKIYILKLKFYICNLKRGLLNCPKKEFLWNNEKSCLPWIWTGWCYAWSVASKMQIIEFQRNAIYFHFHAYLNVFCEHQSYFFFFKNTKHQYLTLNVKRYQFPWSNESCSW